MSGNVRNGYEDIDTLRDPSGAVIILSKRRSNGQISFALMKEFDRDGVTEKTAFLQRRHIDGAIKLLQIAAEEMDKLTDEELVTERDARDAKAAPAAPGPARRAGTR